MRDAVIVDAVRTPTGKRGGGLSGVHSADLSARVLQALAERSGVDPALVDDVVWGCVSQVGEQTFDIARTAVLSAGWPESVPGTTVDRQCGSSQQAVHFAAAGVLSGQYDVAVAGGVEVAAGVAENRSHNPPSPRTSPSRPMRSSRSRGKSSAPSSPGDRRKAMAVSWLVPGARPRPRSMRPGCSASSAATCSATTSGAWLGSMIPPEPMRIRLVRAAR